MEWLSWHVFRRTHATFGGQIGMTLHYTQSDLGRRRESIAAIEALMLKQTAA